MIGRIASASLALMRNRPLNRRHLAAVARRIDDDEDLVTVPQEAKRPVTRVAINRAAPMRTFFGSGAASQLANSPVEPAGDERD
jgi:hypothetical protein